MLRFAARLRESDVAGNLSPEALAKEFGLPVDLIRDSLRFAREGRVQVERGKTVSKGAFAVLGDAVGAAAASVYAHPLISSFIIAAIFFSAFRYVDRYAAASLDAYGYASLLIGLSALMYVNFIQGKVRYAFLTSLVAVATARVCGLAVDLLAGRILFTWQMVADAIVPSLAFTVVLCAFFSIGSVMGALYRARRVAAAENKQDRLHLLQKVFALQERLAASPADARERMRLRSVIQRVRSNWIWIAAGVGVLTGFLDIIRHLAVGATERSPTMIQQVYYLLILIVMMSSFPMLGFIAGNWWRAAIAAVIAMAANQAMWLLPIQGLGFDQIVMMIKQSPGSLINLGILFVMAIVGGIGAAVEERAEHFRKLDNADQAAMLAEIVRLQQLLETGGAEVCVMVVDCVRSTRMKQGADPLAVEISFREFHDFIQTEVQRQGGTIHSKAGDGAVAEFSSANDAFAAARHIQTLISEFNKTSNRIDHPFRLRIGLHTGNVHGGLEKVMFTSVIDIAAHIEKEAPAGGIIVTEDVRQRLPGQVFTKLAQPVDGIDVHLALHPTLD
jgi:class 3 adenylate cyclase